MREPARSLASVSGARLLGLAGLAGLVACSLAYPLDGFDTSGNKTGPGGSPDGGPPGNAGRDGGPDGPGPGPGDGDGGTLPSGARNDGLLVYATRSGILKYRRWNPTTSSWSAAGNGPALPAELDVYRVRARRIDPTRTVFGIRNASADLTLGTIRVFETDGATSSAVFESRTIPPGPWGRSFDIAPVGPLLGGRAMVVYANSGGDLKIRQRTVSGAWTDEARVYASTPSAADIDWVELVARPGTEDVALLWTNFDGDLFGAKWNGTAFGSPKKIVDLLDHQPFKPFAAAFESRSGDLLVVWAAAGGSHYLSSPANDPMVVTTTIVETGGVETGPLVLAPDPASDRIAAASLGFACGGQTCDDFGAVMWTGTSFGGPVVVDADITTSFALRQGTAPIALAWLGESVIAPYHRDAPGFRWARFWDGTWRLEAEAPAVPAIGGKSSFVLFPGGAASMVNVVSDVTGRLWAKRFDGTSWSATENGAALADDLPMPGVEHGVPFDVDTR